LVEEIFRTESATHSTLLAEIVLCYGTRFDLTLPVNELQKRRIAMFTRLVAITTKPGKVRELSNAIRDDILPILENQPGFVDEILLVSNTDADQILALSFWRSQQDADRYTQESYSRVNQLISHLVLNAPVSNTFNVDIFASHGMAGGKAA
jgi:heme-degrading monooxygenase HmoA